VADLKDSRLRTNIPPAHGNGRGHGHEAPRPTHGAVIPEQGREFHHTSLAPRQQVLAGPARYVLKISCLFVLEIPIHSRYASANDVAPAACWAHGEVMIAMTDGPLPREDSALDAFAFSVGRLLQWCAG
jgi:hypothetical protein